MEKKKITARKISSAEEQEQALKLLMPSPPSVSVLISETEIVPPKEKKVRPKKSRNLSASRASLMKAETSTEVQRITVDLPLDLYEALKREVDSNGTTIKWQIVKLLRENLKITTWPTPRGKIKHKQKFSF